MSTAPTRQFRLFPYPVLSLVLGSTWLMLSHSLALVHWLSAFALAWGVPSLLAPFLSSGTGVRWVEAWRLVWVVLWDIVVSNVTVAKLTLGSMSVPRPGWIKVPLASRHDRVNALFASIITTTPGTVSVTVDDQRGEIWVHALNCYDAKTMCDDMKSRYEQPLLRIFNVNPSHSADREGP